MSNRFFAVSAGAGVLLVALAGLIWAAHSQAAAIPSNAPDIAATYELTKRVMSNGTELRPPAVVGLYGMDHGHGNFNLFVKGKDGSLASESTISRYTLTATDYCEWIVYTTRNNLDKPGVTNEAPSVTNHCSRVILKNGRTVFVPPGEGGVVTSFDENGFTATLAGEFVDYWQRIR